jgi:hypothetical protein
MRGSRLVTAILPSCSEAVKTRGDDNKIPASTVNPGGTNERFARTYIRNAEIRIYADNLGILDEIIV